jgi:hypothetical protein
MRGQITAIATGHFMPGYYTEHLMARFVLGNDGRLVRNVPAV